MQPYSAVVLGSTGNVGRQIVNLLAASPAVRQVVVVNRRRADGFVGMPKVREVVVRDMDRLAEAVEPAAREAGATVGFCTIGVGKGSVVGIWMSSTGLLCPYTVDSSDNA
jgi:NAD(P)-dependent dehydrogenase (short-subunit alcohol dehydrogenase family)